jgi:ABC-type polysaccharide/polyol phosphate transport system ATPase subunit
VVLDGFDLRIDAGEVVALVGPSGAGKSTVASLLARFYDPLEGRIAIDGTPLDRYEPGSLREHIGVQLKGSVAGIRMADDDEAPFVRRRMSEFADVLDGIGLPRRIFRSVNHWPAFAIELEVEEVFDQTPGPRAGYCIR